MRARPRARSLRSRAAMRGGVLATEGGRAPLPPRAPPFLHAALSPRGNHAAQCPQPTPSPTARGFLPAPRGGHPRSVPSGLCKSPPIRKSSLHPTGGAPAPPSDSPLSPCGPMASGNHAALLRSRSSGLGSPDALPCVRIYPCWSPCGPCGRRLARGPPPRYGCRHTPAPAPRDAAGRRASCALTGAAPLAGGDAGLTPRAPPYGRGEDMRRGRGGLLSIRCATVRLPLRYLIDKKISPAADIEDTGTLNYLK